ncbi:MAG: putative glycolipid-binding domain-containing protein [Actinomycetota bacterium]
MPDEHLSIHWMLCGDAHNYSDLCRVLDGERGLSLAGTVHATEDGAPHELRYEVRTDSRCRTESVTISRLWPGPHLEMRLARDHDGRWRRDSQPLDGFDGCIDVDLGFTPATNTLPIRRLDLGIGERREIEVLWVLFPELSLQRGGQTYERIADDRYAYSSGDFRAELKVDGRGLVLDYEGLWRAVASPEPRG